MKFKIIFGGLIILFLIALAGSNPKDDKITGMAISESDFLVKSNSDDTTLYGLNQTIEQNITWPNETTVQSDKTPEKTLEDIFADEINSTNTTANMSQENLNIMPKFIFNSKKSQPKKAAIILADSQANINTTVNNTNINSTINDTDDIINSTINDTINSTINDTDDTINQTIGNITDTDGTPDQQNQAEHNSSNAVVAGLARILPGVGTDPFIEHIWILPDENAANGTQIEINPSLERSDIYACIVAGDLESRDTISDVFFDLYHPDGSFKYQVHAQKITDDVQIRDCNDLALAAGLITSLEKDEIEYNLFSQRNWYMYKVYLPMYYHQPSGIYDALAFAVDSTSRISTGRAVSFEWVAGTYLAIDFDTISFGNVQPGAWKVLNGDLDMSTPDMPTIKNEGNTEVKLGIMFDEFKGQGNNPNKVIDTFDAQLRNMGNNNYKGIPGEHIEFKADEIVWFTHPISLCRQEKIDFSIHADIGIVPDRYEGGLTIFVEPVITDAPPEKSSFPLLHDYK